MECQWQDENEDDWVASPAFISVCTIAGGVTINKAAGDATFEPERFVDIRIKYSAPDSLLADDEGRVVYDYWTVRFHHKCADLKVNKGNDIPDTLYLVSSASTSSTLTPTFTLANDDSCTLTTTY